MGIHALQIIKDRLLVIVSTYQGTDQMTKLIRPFKINCMVYVRAKKVTR